MKKHINSIIESEDLKEISIDIVEKVIDNQLSDEVLKEIPIVKSLIAATKIYNSISDRIFIKKAMNVLLELKSVNWKNRIEFLEELKDDYSSGSEKLLLAIDKLDSIEKCVIFGRLCRLKALGSINVNQFLRLKIVIQQAFLSDLKLILRFDDDDKRYEIYEGDYYSIINLGLLHQEPPHHEDIQVYDATTDGRSKISGMEFYYCLTDIGKVLRDNYHFLFNNDTHI